MISIIFRHVRLPDFWGVLRATSIFILLILALSMIVPVMVMVDIHLDRERIARELCVQREVDESMRTCHGQCHLRDRLAAMNDDRGEIPSEAHVLWLIPLFLQDEDCIVLAPPGGDLVLDASGADLAKGHRIEVEQVPKG